MRLLMHTTKTWRAQITKFANNQYQRTSIPILIVGLCTLGVATTGLIYTISNFHSQQITQEENRKKEALRNTLKQYYAEATDLLNENTTLPSDISKDDLDKHIVKSVQWMQMVYQWARQNLGAAAADTLTNGQTTIDYGAAHGSPQLNNLLNRLDPFRDNIANLINSNMWDSMH